MDSITNQRFAIIVEKSDPLFHQRKELDVLIGALVFHFNLSTHTEDLETNDGFRIVIQKNNSDSEGGGR